MKKKLTRQQEEWIYDYLNDYSVADLINIIINYMPDEKIEEIIKNIQAKY